MQDFKLLLARGEGSRSGGRRGVLLLVDGLNLAGGAAAKLDPGPAENNCYNLQLSLC